MRIKNGRFLVFTCYCSLIFLDAIPTIAAVEDKEVSFPICYRGSSDEAHDGGTVVDADNRQQYRSRRVDGRIFFDGRTESIGAVGHTGAVTLVPSDDDFLTTALLDQTRNEEVICETEIVACAKCRIRLHWDVDRTIPDASRRHLEMLAELATACDNSDHRRNRNAPCLDVAFIEERAAFFELGFPRKPYRQVSLLQSLNDGEYGNFTTSAYKLTLRFCVRNMNSDDRMLHFVKKLFPLKLETIDNTQLIAGKPSPHDEFPTLTSEGYLISPRFPHSYPSGIHVNYTLTNTEQTDGFVRIEFEDFQIHLMSQLRAFDTSGEEILNSLGRYGGPKGRPPPFQSSGPNLTLLFTGNSYTHSIGFRIKYKFVREKDWFNQPTKDCDAVFDGFGDSITIPGQNLPVNAYVDCLWVLGKSAFGSFEFNQLYVKVEEFAVRSNSASIHLLIRQGKTSISKSLLDIFGAQSKEELARQQPSEGYVTDLSPKAPSSSSGFYIRLKGYLASYGGLQVTFAQFYRWSSAMCRNPGDFHCHNGRCVKARLTCDQKDHCGDTSDEYTTGCKVANAGHPGSRHRTGGAYGSGGAGGRESGNRVRLGGGLFQFTNIIFLIAGVILLVLVLLMAVVIVARVYKQRLISRFRREVAAAAANRGPHGNGGLPSAGGMIAHQTRDQHHYAIVEEVGSRPGPSVQQIGERRFFVLPEREVSIFEAPPTYDDALKHPSVPPNLPTEPSAASTSQIEMAVASTEPMNTPGNSVDVGTLVQQGAQNYAFVTDAAEQPPSTDIQCQSRTSNTSTDVAPSPPRQSNQPPLTIIRPTVILPSCSQTARVLVTRGRADSQLSHATSVSLDETEDDDLTSSSSDSDDVASCSHRQVVSDDRSTSTAVDEGRPRSNSHHRLTEILKWARHKVGANLTDGVATAAADGTVEDGDTSVVLDGAGATSGTSPRFQDDSPPPQQLRVAVQSPERESRV